MSKVIVITGAGVGLGRALARRFAADGETVVLLGRTASKVEQLASELGDSAWACQCDVADAGSVKGAFQAIKKKHGHIDALINNAAIYEPFLIAEASDRQILEAINTNIAGPILCARAAIPLMRQGALIINVSSESVAMSPFPHLVMYQSTKAALERFSEGLRLELEPSGIRVTNVRAGSMYDDQKPLSIADPEAWGKFQQAAAEVGIDFFKRPVSNVNSVTGVFRALLDLPADFQVASVAAHARRGAVN